MSDIERIGNHYNRVLRGDEQRTQPQPDLTDKTNFIRAHTAEIRPLLPDASTLDQALHEPTTKNVEGILQTFETKILTWKRESPQPDAKKILVEASQPANAPLVSQLFEHLRADPCCGEVTIITDNVAGQKLENTPGMTPVRTDKAPVIADIPDGPYDSVLIMDEPVNSAMPFLRESARDVFGAKKLFYYSPIPAASSRNSAFPNKNWNAVDMFLVSDDFGRDLSISVLDVPANKVEVVGSIAIEDILKVNAEERRTEGRKKLELNDGVTVAVYVGFPSNDRRVSGDVPLNTSTYLKVVEGATKTAVQNPEKQYALVVLTHPRARAVEPLPDVKDKLPSNLSIVNGDGVNRNPSEFADIMYASDLICCPPTSTEAVFAYYRGRSVALCAFEGAGELGELTEKDYPKGLGLFTETKKGTPIKNPSDFVALFSYAHQLPKPPSPPTQVAERLKKLLLDTDVT